MVRYRIRALEYLKFLRGKPDQMIKYTRIWVTDGAEKTELPPGTTLTFEDYSWALESVVAFFARIGVHLRLNEEYLAKNSQEAKDMLGPFFWWYWEDAGIVAWMNECERVQKVQPKYEGPISSIV